MWAKGAWHPINFDGIIFILQIATCMPKLVSLGIIVTEIFAKNMYIFRGMSGFSLIVGKWGVLSKKKILVLTKKRIS